MDTSNECEQRPGDILFRPRIHIFYDYTDVTTKECIKNLHQPIRKSPRAPRSSQTDDLAKVTILIQQRVDISTNANGIDRADDNGMGPKVRRLG